MSLAVAFQMDPIEAVDIDGDSSFALALEAVRRGHDLYHYLPSALSYDRGRVLAKARPMDVRRELGNHATLGAEETLDLTKIDVVLMRQDPPFDMGYIGATHLLEQIHPKTLVVNDPVSVRNAPEKLFVTRFPDLMPPTLITYDAEQIKAFRREYKDIIVKPLYGNGGAGVFHVKPDDDNLTSLLELFADALDEPLMVQQYLPEVRAGDKRIILIDGEPAGALNRVPAEGEARANLHVGGRAEQARPDAAGAGNLRGHRPRPEGAGTDLRRHRRDRRLAHRDQRHVADRSCRRSAASMACRWNPGSGMRSRHGFRDDGAR